MSNIYFLPQPKFVAQIPLDNYLEIASLCERAKIPCAASGNWTKRKIEISYSNHLQIEAEPGDWGTVKISMRKSSKLLEARLALLILAYSLHDLVAKQSIKTHPWAKIPLPKGRIKTGKAMSNAERQRKFRKYNH